MTDDERKERDRKKALKWSQSHPEQSRESVRRYYTANSEKKREYSRKWHIKHPEKKREYDHKWHADHPEQSRKTKLQRRAREKGATVEVVDLEFIWNRANGICYLCGNPIKPDDCHYDHVIPLSKGGSHTTDNLRPTHPRCNLSKGTRIIKWIQERLF